MSHTVYASNNTPLNTRARLLALAVAWACASIAHAASAPAASDAGAATAAAAAEAANAPAADADAIQTVNVQGSTAHTASVGPLGKIAVLDTPLSVNVVSQDVIASQQLVSVTDAFRFLPSVQGDGVRPQTRGIQGSVAQNTRLDGLNMVATTDYPIEQFEQVEVLNGLSGGIYGPANPAGTFNYVQKRPTDQPLAEFTLGYITSSRITREADISNHVAGVDALRYRATLLDDTGTGYTDDSSIHRQLASIALDYQIAPGTVLESNFSHYHFVSKGLPPLFTLGTGARFPDLDATNPNYGNPNAGNDNTTETATVRLRHALNANWFLTAGWLYQIADRQSSQLTDTLSTTGAYSVATATATASRFIANSNLIYLNGTEHWGAVEHDLSFGTNGVILSNYNPVAGSTTMIGGSNLAIPQEVALSHLPDFLNRYHSAEADQQSLMASDNLIFSPRWSALVSGSEAWLYSHNYSVKGVQTSESQNRGFSGSGSLVFKPASNQSVYLTYADSLQQGDVAPATAANAGTILDPYRSKEWEAGYKLALGGVNASAAVYRITRPYAYALGTDNIFRIAGQQRNRGVELMLDGHATRDLSLFGGVSWLDPRLFDTGNASTEGKLIVGLPRVTFNMLASYSVPQVPGLSADLNAHYVTSRETDDANLTDVRGYSTFDLSAAYQTKIMGRHTVFRLSIDNLTNESYWTSILPGGNTGYTGVGAANAQMGAPRQVIASVRFDL
jgi:iron complex outermembrane receptor protein